MQKVVLGLMMGFVLVASSTLPANVEVNQNEIVAASPISQEDIEIDFTNTEVNHEENASEKYVFTLCIKSSYADRDILVQAYKNGELFGSAQNLRESLTYSDNEITIPIDDWNIELIVKIDGNETLFSHDDDGKSFELTRDDGVLGFVITEQEE